MKLSKCGTYLLTNDESIKLDISILFFASSVHPLLRPHPLLHLTPHYSGTPSFASPRPHPPLRLLTPTPSPPRSAPTALCP